MKIDYRPIGFVHSPHQIASDAPIQPSRAQGIEGTVELEEKYVEALSDLDGFSHIILICHLHQATGFKHRVVPYLDTELRGLFATRAPSRPNPIGFSVVRLLGIDGHVLRIEDVDLLDGTPVLDIKPYVRDFDDRSNVRCGWLDEVRNRESVTEHLGFFRVEIEMALEEPIELDHDDEDSPKSAIGYYQLFGVTASSYAEAVGSVEKVLADIVTGDSESSEWLVQLQVDTWTEPAADAEGEFLQDPSLSGVHFISDRAFFLALDEDADT